MKKHTFTITLEFADKITDDLEINEIGARIANALEHEVNNGNGLAPSDSDNYTKSIEVVNNFTDSICRIDIG